LVGYQVRLEAATSQDTQLLFVTPGILLRRLQSSPFLSEFTHIILDEVHERDRYTDFLLVQLKNVLLPKRPDLKLILMSATLQTELLIRYFADDENPFYKMNPPSVLEIEGRTFPVEEFFLEHILEMTGYIDPAEANAASGDAGTNHAMTNEELEAELAKYLGGESAEHPDEVAGIYEINEEFFPSNLLEPETELLSQEDTNSIGAPLDDVMNDEQPLEGDVALESSSPFEAFEAYNEDEIAELDGYDHSFLPVTSSVAPPLNNNLVTSGSPVNTKETIDDRNKWDGIGEFLTEVNSQPDLTPSQDSLLQHYQSMHDDEKVDTDLVLEVLRHVCDSSKDDGAILIFLPGWQEISEFTLLLESTAPFRDSTKFTVLPLHSGIPSGQQRLVLRRPTGGKRKIVLSTNIAETSL